jgi:hypothetical protein
MIQKINFPSLVKKLIIIFLFILCNTLIAQDKSIDPNELMEMDSDRAFELIGRLNKSQSEELITQIRVIARKEYKEIDKFYLLISHLETIKAIEEEEKKLRDLNTVYGLGLFLFVGLVGYSIFAQRKSIQAIEEHLKH